jgi:cysteine desulfurase
MQTVYLDYNATTPLDPGVREVMLPFLDRIWGNPSSVHHVGRQARALLDEGREKAATVLGCKPSEVVFTSGGTESINMAIMGVARLLREKGRHLVTSSIEHHAVLHCFQYLEQKEGFEVTYVPVDRQGRVDPEVVRGALRPDTILVSVMAANNETGTIQPVAKIGALCRERGVVFHTDAVQWFGKGPFAGVGQFNADLVSLCVHKFHGPKGAGALYIKSPLHPEPLLRGGGHENERRAGTENLAAIAGMVEALSRFVREPVFPAEKLRRFSKRLIQLVDQNENAVFAGSRESRLNNTVSFVAKGTDSIVVLAGLDMEGICASSGSACSAGSLEPSHVINAMGFEKKLSNSLIRFSLGRETTEEEISFVEEVLPGILERSQVIH